MNLLKTKLLHIVIISVLLLSMLTGIIVPVSAAYIPDETGGFKVLNVPASSPDSPGWDVIDTPRASRNALVEGGDIDFFEIAPDGETMFAYDNDGGLAGGLKLVITESPDADIANIVIDYKDQDGETGSTGAVTIVNGEAEGNEILFTIEAGDAGVVYVSEGDLASVATVGEFEVQSTEDDSVLATWSVDEGWEYEEEKEPKLYFSDNSGISWSSSNVGDGLDDVSIVAMAVSPDFEDDEVIVVASSRKIYRSNNEGESFAELGPTSFHNAMDIIGAEVITSIAVSTHYKGGIAILVGVADTDDNGTGGVLCYTQSASEWTDFEVSTNIEDGNTYREGDCNVITVAFSPDHKSDTEYLAIVVDDSDGHTYITTKFGEEKWANSIVDARITNHTPNYAVIAFPDNFDWSDYHRLLIGTAGAPDNKNDIYRVTCYLPGNSSYATDLNANGSGTETEVHSLALKGEYYDPYVLVGQKDSPDILYTDYISSSTVYWDSTDKLPTGESNFIAAWSPTTDNCFVASSGTASALSRSIDAGENWSQISLIDVSNLEGMGIVDFAVVDEDTIYFIMDDPDLTGEYEDSLFMTTDGAEIWERILYEEDLAILELSPKYATDDTLFIATTGTRIWKSSDAGESFSGYSVTDPITALEVISSSSYYIGHAESFTKKGWYNETDFSQGVNNIVIAPDNRIFVGTLDGDVYVSTDSGSNFSILGNDDDFGNDTKVVVELDTEYSSNKTIYAGSNSANCPVYRWIIGKSSAWERLDTDEGSPLCTALAVSDVGILYSASAEPDWGIRRCIDPTSDEPVFESLNNDLPDGGCFAALQVIEGSSILYGLVNGVDTDTNWGYGSLLLILTDPCSEIPQLTFPPDNTVVSESVILSWKTVEDADSPTYLCEISTDAGFNSVDTYESGSTSVTITDLDSGMQYWWRVSVKEGSPLASRKSDARTFIAELPRPVLKSPDYGAIMYDQVPAFAWMSVENATSYELELADNSLFAAATSLNMLQHTVCEWETPLAPNTTYYWRVRAVKDDNGSIMSFGPWTESSFTIIGSSALENNPGNPVIIQQQDTPVITLAPEPQAIVTSNTRNVTPDYIWFIIGIGALLIVMVILLIFITPRRMR